MRDTENLFKLMDPPVELVDLLPDYLKPKNEVRVVITGDSSKKFFSESSEKLSQSSLSAKSLGFLPLTSLEITLSISPKFFSGLLKIVPDRL